MFNKITPLILTYNEAPNIHRTLQHLTWADTIVVIDSFSTDNTLEILSECPQEKIFQREFDSLLINVIMVCLTLHLNGFYP